MKKRKSGKSSWTFQNLFVDSFAGINSSSFSVRYIICAVCGYAGFLFNHCWINGQNSYSGLYNNYYISFVFFRKDNVCFGVIG